MTFVRNLVRTGERFQDEGGYNNFAGNTPINTFYNTVWGLGGTPTSVYDSAETKNLVYAEPVATANYYYKARRPLDSGTMKILSNNIAHYCYQQCRTLACIQGPGRINLNAADIALFSTDPSGNPVPLVNRSYVNPSAATDTTRYREIGWSAYSSRRIGPIFGIVDRQTASTVDSNIGVPTIPVGNKTLRKMVLVVEGYKFDTSDFNIHVCLTSTGDNPQNPLTATLALDCSELAYLEFIDGVVFSTTVPATPYTTLTALPRQAFPAYTVRLNEAPSAAQTGRFKLFIPVNCTSNIGRVNSTIGSVSLYEFYAHVGWLTGNNNHGISTITLLEVRDVGSSEASVSTP